VDRETIGKISSELMQKAPDTRDPIELERAMHEEYEKNVYECVNRSKKDFPEDFYVVVITKKEPLMQNVLRNYFYGRISCPTPDYDQCVYFVDRKKDRLFFLWVIPSRDVCFHLKENALHVVSEEKDLLKFVLDFADGTLYQLSRKLNGEEPIPAAT
jgi:hypothetical protein